ncbi:hypothetical protein OPKNFCMD_4669 [Methylobacterium crusticola]|uniref:Flagellar protein FlaG n=1 Tax=Methylobacterium crusticola TaxID=1697972 RepID=A0ABQ4R4M6_9HYPH|nr:hypothetical protein [Methylobacterium crusticola]GJD51910.1 hypothetical protein OPKNFCMD_4669 [Methylobacterium crusticola]
MLEIRSLAAAVAPAVIGPDGPGARTPARTPPADTSLDPAVTLDLSPDARRDGAGASPDTPASEPQALYRRDLDTQQMVFQVVDPDGSVVDQLPTEAALRARTYAREAQAAQATQIGSTVARTA